MSVICRTFVQNAWRSDLCSNCFKSLEDHSDTTTNTTRRSNVCDKLAMPRYVPQAPSLYQSRGISTSLKWRLNESLYDRVSRRDFASQTPNSKISQREQDSSNRGILIKSDSAEKKLKSRSSVDFAVEEALVIGYGGNDYDSDTSPWEMGSDDGSIDFDLLDDTDEDRKITKLTKNNTEFNSSNKNLSSDNNTPSRIKREEEKMNSINNNVSNMTKSNEKSINILTYNDIQSTKTEKKLNQYFFPSSTESIKSYLHGHGNSLIIEEAVMKNNNERPKISCNSNISGNAKIQNCKREIEMKVNSNSKLSLKDDFSPLNTRTYSFVSELNKNNANFDREQSSDSDYSTCRHTAGDSTDSESFHDAEEARISPKPSFLHGTYTLSPQMNESDGEKKYDGGSSTSGDISNFSDDSDAHDSTDRISYNSQNSKISITPLLAENKIHSEAPEVQIKFKKESPKSEDKPEHQDERSRLQKQSPPVTRNDSSSVLVSIQDQNRKTETKSDSSMKQTLTSVQKISPSNSPPNVKKENQSVKNPNTPSTTAKVSSTSSTGSNTSAASTTREYGKANQFESETDSSVLSDKISSSSITNTEQIVSITNVPTKEIPAEQVSRNNLTESDNDFKEEFLHDREFRDYEENSDSDKSPDNNASRQSKLAALALELEMARRDSESKSGKSPVSPQLPMSPPEIKARCSVSSTPNSLSSPSDNYPTIKKASAISCTSRLSTLPDVLQETPAKQKKSKFSLKKLLKRNKDSGTFSPGNSSSKEVNPKAWKKQTFDRNRLSLEIVHPMDLTSDVPTSAESTPTEEHRQIVSSNPGRITFKGVSSRARSLSALPQLCGDEQSGCALIECRKMDAAPARKAGTVAERKKNRPALVRTPSCSALPNRPTITCSQQNHDRAPPPKPPPPPKCKAMHPPPPPPPPHNHPRISKPPTNSPARPPPPKVPEPKSRNYSSSSSAQELHEQNHSDKEYANLGDIRSLMTPKKPQRPSAFSVVSRDSEMELKRSPEGIYETLPVTVEEEEDHYTYLDESEVKMFNGANKRTGDSTIRNRTATESATCVKPWLDLQTSYAAIAAANYESLAELITTSLNEGVEFFKKVEHSLKWRDFLLDSDQFQIIKDRIVYNAAYRNESQEKVTLVVASRKQTSPQNARNQTRYPVLASFNDQVSKNIVNNDNYILQESEMASIYVLQQSKVTTVSDFAKRSSNDNANQYIHLRNYCFVLLQLIHTLKSLQAEGIEEINYDLQLLILVLTDEDKPPILILFPEDKTHLTLYDLSINRKTLCQATLETMLHFLQINSVDELQNCVVNGELLTDPVAYTFRAIAKVLSEEKASSLSQAKGFLEYMLWGPVDVKISQDETDDVLDTILQRWLDLQRAQMVKSSIPHLQSKKNIQNSFHVYEEYQLIFLLQASVKSLKNVISKL